MLPFPESADALCAACEHALISARPRIDLVAVTGASNVTGEVWPLGRLAEIAHRHGAQLFVDGAQLAPHRPIDMAADGIDFLALSGHKLYAPFGAGALVGPVGRLGDAAPLLHGGGAVKLVTLDDVIWADTPERHEAGSPNVVGVVALGAACRALGALGMEAVAEHERTLADRLRRGLAAVPGLEQLAIWQRRRRRPRRCRKLRPARVPPPAARRDPQRRARDRRPPRLLLRASAHHPPARNPGPRGSPASAPSCGPGRRRRCPARYERASGSEPPKRTSIG